MALAGVNLISSLCTTIWSEYPGSYIITSTSPAIWLRYFTMSGLTTFHSSLPLPQPRGGRAMDRIWEARFHTSALAAVSGALKQKCLMLKIERSPGDSINHCA